MTLPSRATSDPPSLSDLVRATRSGNTEALGALYDRFNQRLFRIALRLTGSVADAEDVLHDVFVSLPESLRHYEDRGSLEQWLVRVTGRTALMRLRAQSRRRESLLDDAHVQRIPAHDETERVADGSLGDVERALHTLPESLRTVFVLRFMEGLSHDEIAVVTGITAGASRVRLNRALHALRRLLT